MYSSRNSLSAGDWVNISINAAEVWYL